jgi:RNA polymerase sigma-70 factor (ECF subfamily)
MPRGSDDPLVTGIAAGREEALAAVYDRFAPRLLAAAWGMLGSREEAEDAVQEVFLNLVRSRATLKHVGSLQGYLFTALRHAATRRWSRRARERAPADLGAAERAAAPDAAPAEPSGRLERALQTLPPEQREVVALKIDGGLTFAEIAAVLGTSINTAASRYRYALEKLRERLKEERT